MNQNGKAELIWSGDPTWVLESAIVSNSGPRREPSLLRLSVYPNPVRGRGTVGLDVPAHNAAQVSVYDVAGRLVQRLGVRQQQERLQWHARTLPTGIYILRLENLAGEPIATGRATLIK